MKQNNTTIAYLCSDCNDFSLFTLNIFSFSGNRKKELSCECTHSKLTIMKNSTKSFKIDFICPVCTEEHSFVVPQNQFWSDQVFTFSCPFYEANILFIGRSDKVEATIVDYVEEELSIPDKTPFLPDYQTLEKVIELIKFVEDHPESIKLCSCEDSYTTAYNEKELYIICNHCHLSLPVKYKEIDHYLKNENH